MQTYIAVKGDTWDSIAFKVYGDEFFSDRLCEANSRKHEGVVVFEGGEQVEVPELNLFDVVDDFSALAGQTGDLYWNEAREGKFCVRGVSFSFAIDAIDKVQMVNASAGVPIQDVPYFCTSERPD
ncbi:MAG: hypothetical protein IJ165_09695 [Proteobacteria bacterium]|nr:hypothetical protein [Pseudomonadota bacterium]